MHPARTIFCAAIAGMLVVVMGCTTPPASKANASGCSSGYAPMTPTTGNGIICLAVLE